MTADPDTALTAPQVLDLALHFARCYGAGEVEPPPGFKGRTLAVSAFDVNGDLVDKGEHRE
jgi:hypothetical protein